MKKFICILMSVCLLLGALSVPAVAEGSDDPFVISPADFVQQIGAGWNLGKTLENHTKAYSSVYEQETDFLKVETSQEMINLVADTGFNAVRIPVSFTHQTVKTAAGNYVVKTEYLNRIRTVANMCFKNNMYVIINHSGDDREWLNISVSDAEFEEVKLPTIRKVIAKSMHTSLSTMAQLTLNTSFDATAIMQYRSFVKDNMERLGLANITLNDIILYAVSRTVLNHKDANAHFYSSRTLILVLLLIHREDLLFRQSSMQTKNLLTILLQKLKLLLKNVKKVQLLLMKCQAVQLL